MQKVFFNEASATTGINTINKTKLSKIQLPLVSIDKQNEFTEIYHKIQTIKNSFRNDINIVKLMPTFFDLLFKNNFDFFEK